MAFSLEEIDSELGKTDKLYNASYTVGADENRKIVIDYLTGAINTLHGIIPSKPNQFLWAVPFLFKSPEDPTTNDQLLLDVLLHPNLIPQSKYILPPYLAEYLFNHDTENAINGIFDLYYKLGFNNGEIFDYFLLQYSQPENVIDLMSRKNSAITNFLIHHLPKQLTHNNKGPFSALSTWNYLYFSLIEEKQPQHLPTYLTIGISSFNSTTIATIIQHKNRKYLSWIIEWITSPATQLNWKNKFVTALTLYETSPEEFRPLVIEASKTYLQNMKDFKASGAWEPTFHISELGNSENYSRSFSALAVHFLLPNDKDFVTETINEFHKRKVLVSFDTLKVLHSRLGEEAIPYLRTALLSNATGGGNEYQKQILQLLTSKHAAAVYLPTIWQLVTTKSKVIRQFIAQIIIGNDPSAESKSIQLLENKSADARQLGAIILASSGTQRSIDAVTELLDREMLDDTRDLFLEIIKDSPQVNKDVSIDRLVANAEQRGKLAKPLEPWLEESVLPKLYYRSGMALSPSEIRFLIYRMSRAKGMRSEMEANYILTKIDKETSKDFVSTIIDLYIKNGTKTDQRYLLSLIALIGGDEVVDILKQLINRCIDDNRYKMAEYAVGALALQGSDKALRWVEWYSRKYKTKKANVGAAALQALADAAEEKGISIHELGDKVVPDFGFDGLYKTFTANDEEYRAFIDSKFKLCYFNEEGKSLKTLPSGTANELKEEFKLLGKEIRDVVKSQSGRMEFYLLLQRKWKLSTWKDFFLANPVMFIYATKLLWGSYDSNDRLIQCFICADDTTLLDENDEEILMEENALIGIVHPLLLSPPQLDLWKRKFFDLSIEQVFPQLDRPVYRIESQKNTAIIKDFVGKSCLPNTIKPILEKHGWRSSGTADGGSIESFQLENTMAGIISMLDVDGVFVVFGIESDPKLGQLYFIDRKKQTTRYIIEPVTENDERLIALKDLPPVFYSEVIYSIKSIRLKESEAVTPMN